MPNTSNRNDGNHGRNGRFERDQGAQRGDHDRARRGSEGTSDEDERRYAAQGTGRHEDWRGGPEGDGGRGHDERGNQTYGYQERIQGGHATRSGGYDQGYGRGDQGWQRDDDERDGGRGGRPDDGDRRYQGGGGQYGGNYGPGHGGGSGYSMGGQSGQYGGGERGRHFDAGYGNMGGGGGENLGYGNLGGGRGNLGSQGREGYGGSGHGMGNQARDDGRGQHHRGGYGGAGQAYGGTRDMYGMGGGGFGQGGGVESFGRNVGGQTGTWEQGGGQSWEHGGSEGWQGQSQGQGHHTGYDSGIGRPGGLAGQQQPQSFRGRGPQGYTRSDIRIHEDVNDCLTEDHHIDAENIDVKVQNGAVTLTGTVRDRQQKYRAEELIERISGVKDVDNQLRIQRDRGQQGAQARGPEQGQGPQVAGREGGGSSTFTQASSDPSKRPKA